MDYFNKYKKKYLFLKNQLGGESGKYTGSTITFINRMKKSWKIEIASNMNYSNPRSPHVETDIDGLEGKTFELGQRTIRLIGDKVSVMYDVVGLTNGRFPAHFTIYFGQPIDLENY